MKEYDQYDALGLAELVAAAGLDHPRELGPHHFMRRAAPDRVISFAEMYRFLRPGELLTGTDHPQFRHGWAIPSADTSAPREVTVAMAAE